MAVIPTASYVARAVAAVYPSLVALLADSASIVVSGPASASCTRARTTSQQFVGPIGQRATTCAKSSWRNRHPLRQSTCTSSVVTSGGAGSDDALILRPNRELCGAGASDDPE